MARRSNRSPSTPRHQGRRTRHRCAAVTIGLALVAGGLACSSQDEVRLTPGTDPNTAEGVEERTPVTRTGSLADVKVALRPVAEVDAPVGLTTRAGTDDLYVVQQGGQIVRLTGPPDGERTVVAEPVLDISDRISTGNERGLLGAAFSPDGDTLYVYFTALDGALTLEEYAMAGDVADPASRRQVLSIPHPLPNHNGGQLGFGPDGYLYLGPGDGGGAGDPGAHGQNPDTLLGTILRIDPSAQPDGSSYGIPADNPFADGGGAPEVWAYGLRNPWRFGWDRDTDDLWIADVGQNLVEEINLAMAADGGGRGANYGWSEMEGSQPFNDGTEPDDHVPPLFDYARVDPNCSVTGGYVYRGSEIPELVGTYVYGDYCAAEIRGLQQRDGEVVDERSLDVSVARRTLSSFGRDARGELYVLSLAGTIYRLVPA